LPLFVAFSVPIYEALRPDIGTHYRLRGVSREELDTYLMHQLKPCWSTKKRSCCWMQTLKCCYKLTTTISIFCPGSLRQLFTIRASQTPSNF
jgi:hypothetical protein